MKKRILFIPMCVALLAVASPHISAETAYDYRPVVIDGKFTDARTAYIIETPEKGHIGYHQARKGAAALWFRFEGGFGDRVELQMGVPALDRYRQLRPAIAVLGQDLPPLEETVPFEVPEGFGGVVYHTSELDIERYEDKFTGAISWRFEKINHILQSAGRIYLVGFIPTPENPNTQPVFEEGKFWMAMGHQVNFRLRDLLSTYSNTAKIRKFFEEAVTDSNIYRNGIMGLFISMITLMIAIA